MSDNPGTLREALAQIVGLTHAGRGLCSRCTDAHSVAVSVLGRADKDTAALLKAARSEQARKAANARWHPAEKESTPG